MYTLLVHLKLDEMFKAYYQAVNAIEDEFYYANMKNLYIRTRIFILAKQIKRLETKQTLRRLNLGL